MFSLNPKAVQWTQNRILGQAFVAVCFLLVLTVSEPIFAQSRGKSDPVHPELVGNLANSGIGKNSFASIRIDTTIQFIGQLVEVPILIRNDVEFGGFELEVDFPYQYLTLLEAKRGSALSDTSNGQYEWEYFYYRVLPFPPADTLYRCLILGLCDMPDGHQGIPLALHSDYVSLVVLEFMIANGSFPSGTFFPIIFEWEGDVVNDTVVNDWDCVENTFSDPSGMTTYASQDPAQFNPALCFPASCSLEFINGGIYALYPSDYPTGDINLNWLSYEVADWIMFQRFLLEGDSILTDPEEQAENSDVNCDGLPWSIADLLYFCRIIFHESNPIPCKKDQPPLGKDYPPYRNDESDQFSIISSSAHPGEIVSVPVWLSNSIIAGGITFKVIFDSTVLSALGVDTSQTRIEGWENISPVINPGELFFFGYPDWWQDRFPGIEPGKGVLIKVNLQVDDSAPPGTFLPITFQAEPNRGHYNAYTDTIGLTFVQPSTVSGWIFTDVILGDANSDGIVDVGDLICLINYLYRAGMPPNPLRLGDYNQDGEVNIADVVAIINYLFRG